jgi:hypothetical protein
MALVKDEDIVRAISNDGVTRVRQFGLYPLWTSGNLRGAIPSKHLLLYAEMRNDNVAYNGETFICFWF